jgi:hypothetical protein
VEEALARAVGLDPFAVEDELRDGSLADVGDDLGGGAGGALDVDFLVGDLMGGEEAFGFAAVSAPGRGVEEEFHGSILRWGPGKRLNTDFHRGHRSDCGDWGRLAEKVL